MALSLVNSSSNAKSDVSWTVSTSLHSILTKVRLEGSFKKVVGAPHDNATY